MNTERYLKYKLLFIACFSFWISNSQEPKYLITNYENEFIDGATWCAVQDTLGFMYFGVDAGVMVYNGSDWQFVNIGNETTRCLFSDSKNNLWYGAVNNFGRIKKSAGKGIYCERFLQSEEVDFGDVWSINEVNGEIYFQTRQHLFIVREDQEMVTIPLENSYHRAFVFDNLYIINEQRKGLCSYNPNGFIKLAGGGFFKNKIISGAIPVSSETILIGTRLSGVFRYNIKSGEIVPAFEEEEVDAFLKNYRLYSMLLLPDGNIIIATLLNGSVIINKNGKILKRLNSQSGVKDNKHYAVYLSRNNILWMCSQAGCSAFDVDSPLSFWDSDAGIEGVVVDIKKYKKNILCGGSSGLFLFSKSKDGKTEIEKLLNAEIWDLCVVDNGGNKQTVLVASSNGLYELHDKSLRKVLNNELILKVEKSTIDPNSIFAFTPDEIIILNISNNYSSRGRVSGLYKTFRKCAFSGAAIWIGTRTGQLIRLNQKEILKWCNSKDVEIDLTMYNVGQVTDPITFKNQTFFSNRNGLFNFNNAGDTLETCKFFGDEVTNLQDWVTSLEEDNNGNIWLGGNKILIKKNNGSYFIDMLPSKTFWAKNLTAVIMHDGSEKTWLGGDNGLCLYDRKAIKLKKELGKIAINKIVTVDSIFSIVSTSCHSSVNSQIHLNQDFTIHFSLPYFGEENQTKYSFFLDGYSKEWSEWDKTDFATYTNLNPGEYTLKVKGQITSGDITDISCIRFVVDRPWYRSIFAIVVYIVCLAIGSVVMVQLIIKAKVKRKMIIERLIQERLQQNYFHDYTQKSNNTSSIKSEIVGLSNVNDQQKQSTAGNKNKELLYTLLDFIDANVDNPDFNVEILCREMEMNQSTIYRKIKSHTGLSIASYINKVRLKKSFQLLKDSNLTISEIAFKVGFNDPAYFSKCFHKEYGQSPSSVR